MLHVTLGDRAYPCETGETVLDALTKGGASVPSSCRTGVCQTCLLRATEGVPPGPSQAGLKETLRAQNYFLACQCIPDTALRVELPSADVGKIDAEILALTPLSKDTLAVTLQSADIGDYHAGQFINVFKDERISRSYSLASAPGVDPHLTLHVRRIDHGKVSGWIHDMLKVGHTIPISRPIGDSFYVPSDLDQPLLLLGTGSGLAPLYGIVRAALHHGHRGVIRLYHGSRDRHGLYLMEELRALAKEHHSFRYEPCVSQETADDRVRAGRVLDVALQDLPTVSGMRAYLCGHPDMVRSAKKRLYLSGAALKDIYADAFIRSAVTIPLGRGGTDA